MYPNKNKSHKIVLNPKTKPELLRNNEWQALLRKQFAHIQKLKVTNVGSEKFYSEYDVFNPQTKNKYKVAIRSVSEPKNFCSCYDFKTNKLGTCKHIEAVFFQLESLSNVEIEAAKIPERKYTSIYVDYLHHRKIKIRIGIENTSEINQLTKTIFDTSGLLNEQSVFELKHFIDEYHSKLNIKIYDDAHELIDAIVEHQFRIQKVTELKQTKQLDNLLPFKLYQHQSESVFFALQHAKVILSSQLGLGAGVSALAAILIAKKQFSVTKVLIVSDNFSYWQSKVEHFANSTAITISGSEHTRKKAIELPTDLLKITSPNDAAIDAKHINHVGFDFIVFDDATLFENLNNAVCKQLKTLKSKFMLMLATRDLKANLEGFYSQIQTIDMYLPGSIFNFINRYAIKNVQGKIVALKNENELLQHLQFSYQYTSFADVKLSLDSSLTKTIHLKLSQQQQALYDGCIHEQSISFKHKTLDEKLESAKKILTVCTSSYLYYQSNNESKLLVLLQLMQQIGYENSPTLLVCEWEIYKEFMHAFLQHNGIEIEPENGPQIIIKTPEELSKEMLANYTQIICLDVSSFKAISAFENSHPHIKYVLIAEHTFENAFYNSNEDLIDFATKFLDNNPTSEIKVVHHKPSEYQQLSFLGDDDIEELEIESKDNTLEDVTSLFSLLNEKLLDDSVRKQLLLNKNLPEKLRRFLELY